MPTNGENASNNIPSSMADLQLNQPTNPGICSASHHKAVVVGLYGVPGSGKPYLLNQLEQRLGKTDSTFYEGSKMIATVVPGGLEAFHRMEEQEKAQWRRHAIDAIGKSCAVQRKSCSCRWPFHVLVIGAVVVTCGLRRVGDKVLKREDLSKRVFRRARLCCRAMPHHC